VEYGSSPLLRSSRWQLERSYRASFNVGWNKALDYAGGI